MAINPTDTQEIRGRKVRPNDDHMGFLADLGHIADDARQIATDLGVRPYRVFLVKYQSEGGEMGIGETYVKAIKEILPTPKVSDLQGIVREASMAGILERGDIRIKQISLVDFNEDILLGLDPKTGASVDNEKNVWIVTEATDPRIADLEAMITDLSATDDIGSSQSATDGAAYPNVNAGRLPANRCFVPQGAPFLNAERASWEVTLKKIEPNFTRAGQFPMTAEAR